MSDRAAPPLGDVGGGRKAAFAAVIAVLAVLFAEAFYLLVVHEEPGYPTAAHETGPVPQPEPTERETDASTPDATPLASEVGETRFAANADTTLLQIRRIRAPASRSPAPGEEWFGIRARTCLHEDARPSGGLRWSSWGVTDEAGKRYLGSEVPWDDYPPQQLPTTGLAPGGCNLGWVLIALPEGTFRQVVTVLFRPKSPSPAEWVV